MHVEVSIGLNFVISYLYNKLPRRRVDFFAEELEKEIKMKFDGHWYPEKPFKGSAFRCIKASGDKIDPVMELAAVSCALDITEIQEYLPKDLTIWIDPNEVSYRIGEKGIVKILYSDRKETEEHLTDICVDSEVQIASKSFNPDAQSFRPIETLSTSLNNLNLSPADGSSPTSPWGSPSPTQGVQQSSTGSSPINSFLNRGNDCQSYMSAATFAATKFGSTKLKSHAKRPTRLSPTDFGSYIKQRSILQSHWMSGVGAVSPIGGGGISTTNGLPSPHGYPSVLPPQQIITQQQQPQVSQPPPQHLHQQHAGSLSPRDPRQELFERQRLMLIQQQLQQQQQQQQQRQQQQQQQQKMQQLSQLQNNNILGSYGASFHELHQFQQQQQHHPQLSPNLQQQLQHQQQQQQQQQHQQHQFNSSSMFSGFNNIGNSSVFGGSGGNINGGVNSTSSGGNNDINGSNNLLHVKCPPTDFMTGNGLQGGLAAPVSSNSTNSGNNAPSMMMENGGGIRSSGSSSGNSSTGNENENVNWNSLPPYAHLQHLLVAN